MQRPPFDTKHENQSALIIGIDRRADPPTHRITVAGDLDALNGGHLHQAVIEVLRRQQPQHIEIDLHRVTFLDSAGIRVLLLCHRDAQHLDCRLTLTGPRPMAHRVLQITGLLDHFGLTEAHTAQPTPS
jgi:anti-sigma B factor antagonist